MLKRIVKSLIGRDTIDRVRYFRDRSRLRAIHAANRFFGVRYVNLGAGADGDRVGWWAGDVQTGFVFDAKNRLPLPDNSIEFAYSSMFFEHLYDDVVAHLLREACRTLKPGKCLRIVVPDFRKYIAEYRAGNRGFFYSDSNPNFQTWATYNVPTDMEHLLVNMISAIDNIPLEIVPYRYQENLKGKPAKVHQPFQDRVPGYYCGPAPELTTTDIRTQLQKPDGEFLNWVFEKTNGSKYQNPDFNSWHKNEWTLEKLSRFARDAGFGRVEASAYGVHDFPIDARIEKPGHEPIGLYFNLYKA